LTLDEAWALVAARTGLELAVAQGDEIVATGSMRGRDVDVRIATGDRGRDIVAQTLMSARDAGQRKPKARSRWASELSVSCRNPARLIGTITSAVDVTSADWDPRHFDPAAGRTVVAEPALLSPLLTESIRTRLMSILADVCIEIGGDRVRLATERTATREAGFIGGCVLHHYVGPVQPMPDRAIAGPIWWIELLCDLADAIDVPSRQVPA